MNDLIRRQDVIDMLAEMQGRCTSKTALIQNSKIWQQIKDLPSAHPEPRWIPCSERLPEEHEWIGTKKFGTTVSDIILITFDVKGERFVKPMSLQNGALGPSDKQTMDVFYKEWEMLAWMPLPKPWRGEANDDI